jgi:hypothetical protein
MQQSCYGAKERVCQALLLLLQQLHLHALLKVIEGNDKLRNIHLIQFIDDMVKDHLGQLAAESLKK